MLDLDNDGFHPTRRLITTCEGSSEQQKHTLGRARLDFGALVLDRQGTQRRAISCCFELDV